MKLVSVVIGIIAVMFFVSTASACFLTVLVVDQEQPVEDATVRLYENSHMRDEHTTNDRGATTFNVEIGTYRIVVGSVEESVTVTNDTGITIQTGTQPAARTPSFLFFDVILALSLLIGIAKIYKKKRR